MGVINERIGKNGVKSFHVRIRLKGNPLVCGTFPNKTKAKEFIQRTEASVKEGRYFKDAEAKKHTLGDLVDRYIRDILSNKPKHAAKQRMKLLYWKNQLGQCFLSDLIRSPSLIIEQRDELARGITRSGNPRSPATVVRYLAALSHAFSIAMKEWQWVDDNPLRKVSKPKEPRGRVRFLDDDERARLLNVCKTSSNAHLYTIVVLALSTGMRYSEIMNLTWKDIDFDEKRIILQQTKNNERRPVPLVGLAFELLQDNFRKHRIDSFLVFPGKRDSRKATGIRSAWERAIKEAGIEDFRFHDLRHSFASEMAMGKATETELRILLGHKSHSMTARYSHLTEKHTNGIVSRMTDRIFPVAAENLDLEMTK